MLGQGLVQLVIVKVLAAHVAVGVDLVAVDSFRINLKQRVLVFLMFKIHMKVQVIKLIGMLSQPIFLPIILAATEMVSPIRVNRTVRIHNDNLILIIVGVVACIIILRKDWLIR